MEKQKKEEKKQTEKIKSNVFNQVCVIDNPRNISNYHGLSTHRENDNLAYAIKIGYSSSKSSRSNK